MSRGARTTDAGTVALATAIREAQARQDITGAELARRAGMAPATVNKIRKGAHAIDFEQLIRLAGALGLRPSDLVGRAEALCVDIVWPQVEIQVDLVSSTRPEPAGLTSVSANNASAKSKSSRSPTSGRRPRTKKADVSNVEGDA